MVQCDNGHWNRVTTPYCDTFQGGLAILAVRGIPGTQRHPLHLRLLHLRFPIRCVSGDLDCDDCGQRQFALSRDNTDGLRHTHLSMVRSVHSIFWPLGCHLCLGLLDD